MVSLTTLSRTIDPALGLLGDVIRRPTFASAELERLRADRLTSLMQQRDSPAQVAIDLMGRALYGERHRYGQPLFGTEAALKSLTRDDVVAWQTERLGAKSATVIVVGDVKPDQVMALLTRVFAGWTGGKQAAPRDKPALPASQRRVLFVDRPGAAQAEVRFGQPGVERRSRDYFPLLVANTVLGGQFSSRLNLNLREKHGYTYGARTEFSFRREGGPFLAGAPVKTAVTRPALEETLKELDGIRSSEIAAAELRLAKDMLERQLARTFETPPEIAAQLATLRVYGLPDDYYATYAAKVEAVTVADVRRAATAHLDPKHMVVTVVGDLKEVGEGVAAAVGKPEVVDALGRPVDAAPGRKGP
jgi:zinc protease